jgi:hypothetical protein
MRQYRESVKVDVMRRMHSLHRQSVVRISEVQDFHVMILYK